MLKGLSSSCVIGLACGLVLAVYAVPAVAADAPCAACHAKQTADFAVTPHGKAFGDSSCSGCHGDGQAHLAAPGKSTIQTFSSEPAEAQNAVCSTCHGDAHAPEGNAHSAAGITCSSCHSVHKKKR